MFVPLRYNLRSLALRRVRTALTVIGIGAVVSVYVVMSSVSDQIRTLFKQTGGPDEIIVTQAGALNAEFSSVSRASATWLRTQGRVAQDAGGVPRVSPELMLSSQLVRNGVAGNVLLRGVSAGVMPWYQDVRVAEGGPLGPGKRIMVGRQIARARKLHVADAVDLEGERWTVAGVFTADGTVYEQEIWLDVDELGAAANRADLTHFTVWTRGAADARALVDEVNGQRAEPLQALTAEAAYARVGGMSVWMSALGKFIAIIIALGAVFGGMNTMFTAVASRAREIGILRAVGYRGGAILVSFLLESATVGLAGGVLGGALAFAVARVPLHMPYLLDGEVVIRSGDLVAGLVLSAVVSLAGGFVPALQAARVRVVDVLR